MRLTSVRHAMHHSPAIFNYNVPRAPIKSLENSLSGDFSQLVSWLGYSTGVRESERHMPSYRRPGNLKEKSHHLAASADRNRKEDQGDE